MQSIASDAPSHILPATDLNQDIDVAQALRWRVILLCALVCLVDGYDMSASPVGIPLMAADWGIAPQAFSFALSAAVLGTGLGAGFLAPLGDRFGRRPIIIGSYLLVGLASLVVCVITNVNQLVGLRLLIGGGFGASIANAVALASEYATPLWRSRVAASVYAMAAVGGAVGSFIAPMIIEPFAWHGIYAIGGGIPLFLVPVLFFGLAESRRFLVLRNASPKKFSPAVAGPTKGALDGLRRLLVSPYRAATILIWTLSFLGISAVYLISSWLPTLMSLAGWSVSNSARSASAYSFGGIIGGVLLGWLVDKGHIKLSLLIAFGAAALALAGLSFVPPLVPIWMVLIAIMGGGTIAVTYVLAAIAAVVYPTSMRASGIGAFGAIGRVGATLAPLVGGWLLANGFSALQILTSLVVPMTIGFVIMMIFSKHLEPDPANGRDA